MEPQHGRMLAGAKARFSLRLLLLDLGRLTKQQRQTVFDAFGPKPEMQLYARGIRRRLATMLNGDQRRLELAYSLLFTLPGTPVIRYGDEIGTGDNLSLLERNCARTPMQWSNEPNAGFTKSDKPLLPVISGGHYGFEHINAAIQRRHPDALLNWTERIIRIQGGAGNWLGEFTIIPNRDHAVLIIRYDWRNNSVLFIHNLDSKPREIAFSAGLIGEGAATGRLLVNLLSDDHSRTDKHGRHRLIIEGYGYRWYRVGGLDYLLRRSEVDNISRTMDDDQVAAVIERTLRTTPLDATHWSIRSMAAETGFSHTTIRRMWVAFGLQPHRSQTFKLSNDPLFVDKVRDIVGLYLSPPNRALVLSIDEKSQIQALNREQPVLPMMPGVPERRTHSYVRHGTTSLFAGLDVASGFVIGKCYKRHRAAEFLNFLKEIDAQVPEGLDIHIVMDNYATHKIPKIRAWLARRPHYHVHFTPTSASWINQVERWFAELTRKRLRRGIHTSVRQLEADIRSFIDRHNQNPRPFKWTKSADQILASVKRFCHKAQQTLCREL